VRERVRATETVHCFEMPFQRPPWLSTEFVGAIVAWTAVATNVVLVSFVLFFRREPRVDVPRVLLAFGALALWVGFQLVMGMRISRFLCIHLVYLDTFVLLPLMGIVLLRRKDVVLTKSVRGACLASLALVPIGLYSSFVEPYMLVTERTTVALSPKRAGIDPITIGVLADIQCISITDRERDAVARIMAAQPDLILIPGDLVQLGGRDLDRVIDDFRALLAPLDAPLGVYFVQGNCEAKKKASVLLEETRVKFLDNEIVELRHGDRRITLCGVDLEFSAPARDVLRQIETSPGDDDVRIVVAHRPDVMYALPSGSRVDLVVAGHTHGGQVQLPFYGPPITLSEVPRNVAAGGLHELEGRRIYVSRGLGWEHDCAPRVRFLAPPEVSLLTLESRPSATTPP
jgi:predicted MPP superfamily phosphohydrolase